MSLITSEDEERVAQIAEATRPSEKDALWLCTMVHKLAKIKPMEFDFPYYAALIQEKSYCAYALRFVKVDSIEKETICFGPRPSTDRHLLIDTTTSCLVTDALMCVRPYIRVGTDTDRKSWSPKVAPMLERIARKATIRANVDGVRVIDDVSAEAYLVGADGYGLHRKPSDFIPPREALQEQKLFGVGALDFQSQATPLPSMIFLPGSSTVEIWISGLELSENEKVTLSTGVVMGLYTTKGAASNPQKFGREPGPIGAQS